MSARSGTLHVVIGFGLFAAGAMLNRLNTHGARQRACVVHLTTDGRVGEQMAEGEIPVRLRLKRTRSDVMWQWCEFRRSDFAGDKPTATAVELGIDQFIPGLDARLALRTEFGLLCEGAPVGLVTRLNPQKYRRVVAKAARAYRSHPSVGPVMVDKGVDASNALPQGGIDDDSISATLHLPGQRGEGRS